MAGNPLLKGHAPTHPGEDIVPALGLPKAEVARRLGISRHTLYDILDEKQPMTPAMALRLGRFLGNGPDFWLNLQRDHDLRTNALRSGQRGPTPPTTSRSQSLEVDSASIIFKKPM